MGTASKAHPESNDSYQLEIRVVIFSLRGNRLLTLLLPMKCEQKACWQITGLPVDFHRSLEQTANQCLAPYMDRHEVYLEQLYTYGDPSRCTGNGTISIVYYALIPADAFNNKYASQTGATWFPLDDLPCLMMDHADILSYALRRLRYKLEYSAAGFELLPENFSLSELQQTYEMILGEKLDKRNFRRRILKANVIEPTPHQRTGEGRPARLFRYRPDAIAEVKARRLFP